MSLLDIENTLNAMNQEIKALKDSYRDKTKIMFSEMTKEVFGVVDDLKAITWVQYTPYFNDGDECIFGVHELEFHFTDEDREEGYQYGDAPNPYEKPSQWVYDNVHKYASYKKEIDLYEEKIKSDPSAGTKAEVLDKFKTIFRSIENDTFRDLFGDHSQITIFRDGQIEVEEYSHD